MSALRKQIETVFQGFERGSPARATDFSVRSNVSETDNEICITAVLPGIDEKDIDIFVTASRMVIKVEKNQKRKKRRNRKGGDFFRSSAHLAHSSGP